MKKTILTIAIAISAFISNAQINLQTSFGILNTFQKEEVLDNGFVNLLGIEFDDRVGIEYGFTYRLNNNQAQLNNYLYGNSNSYTAGTTNHLVAIYLKSKPQEGSRLIYGVGASILSNYKATDRAEINTSINPYIKLGLEHKLSKRIGGQISFALGKTFGMFGGVSIKL